MNKNKRDIENIKKEARRLYCREGLLGKEVAQRLSVSERTVSLWVNENEAAWKKERNTRVASSENVQDNIRKIIELQAEKRISLMEEAGRAELEGNRERVLSISAEIAGIDSSIEKWSKQRVVSEKNNRITISIYIDVLDQIFKALSSYDSALYMKTLDFQEQHINEIVKKLG